MVLEVPRDADGKSARRERVVSLEVVPVLVLIVGADYEVRSRDEIHPERLRDHSSSVMVIVGVGRDEPEASVTSHQPPVRLDMVPATNFVNDPTFPRSLAQVRNVAASAAVQIVAQELNADAGQRPWSSIKGVVTP
jgi:hypothetical protein